MIRSFSAFCICLFSSSLFAQTDPVVYYANTITAADLQAHLEVLASDAYEGRETGTRGQVMAAEYISHAFKSFGIPGLEQIGGYYQEYPLMEYGWESCLLSDHRNTYGFLKDFYGYAQTNNSFLFNDDALVFLGYGIDDSVYSDYKNVDVAGKIVLIMDGEPMHDNISYITGTDSVSDWSRKWKKKIEVATQNKVACLLIIDPDFNSVANNPQWQNFLSAKLLKLKSEYANAPYCANLFISREMAESMLGNKKKFLYSYLKKIDAHGEPANFKINTEIQMDLVKSERLVYAENVLGYIEGTDLKDQLIVVSAHYDHLGKRGDVVYNGADDDGSGTVSLLEMAQALAQAKADGKGPRRSVLFLAFSGEEKGLLGSSSYTDDPVFPLENTVADLNIDMIGRVDDAHLNDSNYVYIIGSDMLSTELHRINEAAAKNYTDLSLDYTYNSTDDPNRYYYRSDHYNFAKHNIPVIFYFNGSHADYHQPTDDVDKIAFDLMAKRARLVFCTLWIVANQDHRLSVDVPQN